MRSLLFLFCRITPLLALLAGCAGAPTIIDPTRLPAMPALAAADAASNDDLAAKFRALALRPEYGPDGSAFNRGTIVKWDGPITIFITAARGVDPAAYQPFLDRQIARLARLSGLSMRFARRPEDANFTIALVRRAATRKAALDIFGHTAGARHMARIGRCMAVVYPNERGIIRRARVFLSIDLPAIQLMSCIIEETTQALGLLNDSDLLQPTIFSDATVLPRLPWHDALMVAALYDPRLRPGMTSRALDAVLPAVIAEAAARYRPVLSENHR